VNNLNANFIQYSVSGTTNNGVAYWPVLIAPVADPPEDEFGWLRRRVKEITDLVAVG